MTENRKTPKLRFKGFTDAWEQRKEFILRGGFDIYLGKKEN